MAIFGAPGIRDAVVKAYCKHLEFFSEQPPDEGMTPHHAALHGALVLRYAAAYRAIPEAVVWLELGPFVNLDDQTGLQAVAEYVVFKERPQAADVDALKQWVRLGWDALLEEERQMFHSAADTYRFPWRKLVE